MKIILSRKGFDSSSGGYPSPIMPDGAMLSMPIPSEDSDKYENLEYGGISYSKLLKQLNPKASYTNCHVDPDIRSDIRKNPVDGWLPAFGQTGSANSYLSNKVEIGDLFLFFGWFHRVVCENGKYRYTKKNDCENEKYKDFSFYDYSDLHAIWGYLQIGEIITDPEEIRKYTWHPHASSEKIAEKSNALYIPAKHLSFDETLPGYGTLNYRRDRVLTMEGQRKRSEWVPLRFMMPDKIYGNRKNSTDSNALYYAGIWQEIVLKDSAEAENWAKQLLSEV